MKQEGEIEQLHSDKVVLTRRLELLEGGGQLGGGGSGGGGSMESGGNMVRGQRLACCGDLDTLVMYVFVKADFVGGSTAVVVS